MTPKSLTGLAGVTFVAVVAAMAVVSNQVVSTQHTRLEQPVLEGFEDQLNSVSGLSVQTAHGKITVERKDTGWVVAENGGYPAERENVHRVLLQLSQLALVEPKTKLVDRYSRIEVEDVDGKDAKSSLLTLNDAGGIVAQLIVGKQKHNMAGGSGKGVYLRKKGEERAWLANGELDLRKRAIGWLAKDVLDVAEKRIKRITTTSAAGDVLVVSRDDPKKGKLGVQAVPEGKKLKKDALEGFGGSLSELKLTDVKPFSNEAFPAEKLAWAEIVTFDGLVLVIAMNDTEDGIWARIEASTSGDTGTSGAEGRQDVEVEAAKINARTGGWAYQIPDFKFRPLLKTMTDLLDDGKSPS